MLIAMPGGANHTQDERWFNELISIRAPLLLHTLAHPEPDHVLFKRFLDRREPPSIQYRQFPITAVEKAIEQCRALLPEIIHNEGQSAIRELYTAKVTEILEIQLTLRAVYYEDAEGFADSQKALFSELDEHVVNSIIRPKVRNTVEAGDILSSAGVSDDLWDRAVRIFPLMQLPPASEQTYSAPEIVDLWNEAMSQQFGTTEWRTELSNKHFRITVAARPRIIYIPTTTRMGAAGLRRLFAHEVGAHISRRIAAKKSSLMLLRMGTAKVYRFEEGLALMAEQLALNSPAYRGIDKYTALAIATGVFDGDPKDFQGTFDALIDYFSKRFGDIQNRAHAHDLANKHAWVHTRSIFRTSKPERTDMHFLRGKIYLEGNIEAWNYLKDNTDNDFRKLFTGRITPHDLPLLKELHTV